MLLTSSQDRGRDGSTPVAVQQAGDRPDFPAVAISPSGADVCLTDDAFLAPWRFRTTTSRPMLGVVRHAEVAGGGVVCAFTTLHRGEIGDARGSSESNLCCEFLGDYNYVSATRTFAAANWNLNSAVDLERRKRYPDDLGSLEGWGWNVAYRRNIGNRRSGSLTCTKTSG